MSNPFDHPEVKQYLDHAEKKMLPKLMESALCVSINATKPDIKQCLEMGAAVLFDKPIVLVVPEGTQVSSNMKRCAAIIIHGDITKSKVKQELTQALQSILKNDKRVRK